MKAVFSTGLVAVVAICMMACGGRSEEQIRASIERLIETDSVELEIETDDDILSDVRTYYRQRDFEPAWVEAGGSTGRLRDVLDVLCGADELGLNRADYVHRDLQQHIDRAYGDEAADDSVRAHDRAVLDVAVTHSLMQYASHVLMGRVNPRDLGTSWNTPVYEIDLLNVFSDTASIASIRGLSERKAQTHQEYGALLNSLEQYRIIEDSGGWSDVSPGEPLAEGDEGPRVAAVIRRLAATGDVDSSLVTTNADSARYDTSVVRGVERFQRRHGIEPDGATGEDVLTKMNVPVDERIRQLELNLERWRWIPSTLGSRYIYVNVPAFELHVIEDGEEAMSMAVVVGEEYDDSATPVFSDTMEYVVFNPYWNIPESIATDEILPEAREDPDYLAENEYEIVTDWSEDAEVLSPDSRALDLVEAGEYRIRQQPGPENALGRIKFMFPNDFNIYLHDTPEDHLFEQAQRAYSHGCIRVERPVELADFVLTSDEWTSDAVRSRIESRDRSMEPLADPIPIYILYWTAFVDQQDRTHFRDDIYGNDATLRDALDERTRADERVACDALTADLDD